MLEYAFFDEAPEKLFVDFVRQLGCTPQQKVTELERLVMLPDDLDEALVDEIEDKYDELLEMSEELIQQQNPSEGVHLAGIRLQLANGQELQAAIPADLMSRVLSVISTDELAVLVDAIVLAVETKDDRSLCQR